MYLCLLLYAKNNSRLQIFLGGNDEIHFVLFQDVMQFVRRSEMGNRADPEFRQQGEDFFLVELWRRSDFDPFQARQRRSFDIRT